jgi:hypothetical protein
MLLPAVLSFGLSAGGHGICRIWRPRRFFQPVSGWQPRSLSNGRHEHSFDPSNSSIGLKIFLYDKDSNTQVKVDFAIQIFY